VTVAGPGILLSRGEAGIYSAQIRPRELEEDSMSCSSGRAKLQICLASAVLVFAVTLNVQAAGPGKHLMFQEPDTKTQTDAVRRPAEPPAGAAKARQETDEIDQLRAKLRQLAGEVERLGRRVSNIEKDRIFEITRVLLVGEEQRAESLQTKLRELFERQTIWQVRLEHIDQQLRPENIERVFVGAGLVRPEEAREGLRRRLSSERQSIMATLEALRSERTRIQISLSSSDLAIQRLRLRLAEAARP
jgi:uncharacterized membrane protein